MVAHRQASRRCLALDTLAPRAFIGNVPSPTLGCLVSPWSDLATPHFPSFPASCTRTVNVGASPPVSGHACQSNSQVPLAWGERRAGEKLPKRFTVVSRFVLIARHFFHRTLWVWNGWSMHVSRRQASEQRSTNPFIVPSGNDIPCT